MRRDVFCTIVTPDYVPFALALNTELSRFQPALCGVVLVVNASQVHHPCPTEFPDTEFLLAQDIGYGDVATGILRKYGAPQYLDSLRWSLKPILMDYLLTKRGFSRVLFCDPDLFFFSAPVAIFDDLNACDVVLVPHWRSVSPMADPVNFSKLFTEGLYNGGLLGAGAKGTAVLDWWARACLFECAKDIAGGRYDDQKYLDAMPAYFAGVGVLRHRGYDLAEWNRIECPRTASENGAVQIAGRWPVVCIHFTRETCAEIAFGEDELLRPHMDLWAATLRRYAPEFDLNRYMARPRRSALKRIRTQLRWAALRVAQRLVED